MRVLLWCIVLIQALFALPGDLVKNGNFEGGTTLNNIPLHWGTTPYNQTLVRGYQNSRSLLITRSTPGDAIGAQIIPLQVPPNTMLSLIGQIKGSDIIPEKAAWQGAKAQVIFLDKNGKEIAQAQETPAYSGTFDWQLFVQNILVPAGATQAKILLGLWGAQGAVYFDDIMLYPMAKKQIKRNTPSLIVNGDFELWGNWQFVGEGLKEIKFPGNNNEGQALYITNTRHTWTFATQEIPVAAYADKKLILQGQYKCTKVVPGKEKWQKGRIYLEYLDKNQERIGSWEELLSVDGTKDWTAFAKTIVPPAEATTMRIFCGLQEASGEIAFDELTLNPVR